MSHTEPSEQITSHAHLTMEVPDGFHLCAVCSGHGCQSCQSSGIVKNTPALTADIYGTVETEIANVMAQFPRVCATRREAIRALRDGWATVIADDVVAGQTPDEGTVAKYAAALQLLADEVAS